MSPLDRSVVRKIGVLLLATALPLGAAQGKPPKNTNTPVIVVNPAPVDCVVGAGCFDASFGVGGKVLQDVGGRQDSGRGQFLNAIAVQPDGKILAAGMTRYSVTGSVWVVARFESNGALDSSFGTGGIVTLSPFTAGSDVESIYAMALQSDGRILVGGSAGSVNSVFVAAVVRLEGSGNIDATYGSNGVATLNAGGHVVYAMALQGDGRALVVVSGGGTALASSVARLNTNGSLDTTFGSAGLRAVQFTNGVTTTLTTIKLQSNGKIIVGGESSYQFALARLTTSGSFDNQFGSAGKVTLNFNNAYSQEIKGLAVAADDSIVAAGRTCPMAEARELCNMAFARFTASGALQTSFGSAGKVLLDMHGGYDQVNSLAFQGDGKVVFAGSARLAVPGVTPTFPILGRLTATGTLDGSFGTGGVRETTYAAGSNLLEDNRTLAIDATGRIVVGGLSDGDLTGVNTWMLARFIQ